LLHPPDEVDGGEDADEVDEAVQALPALDAETADTRVGGGECERDQQHERGEADVDELPLNDVEKDRVKVEALVEDEVGHEVTAGVKEGEQAEHAPDTDGLRPAEQDPQRRHRECGEKK